MFCSNQEHVFCFIFRVGRTISGSQPVQNTLINKEPLVKFWLNSVELVEGLTSNFNLKGRLVSLYGCSRSERGNQSCKTTPPIHHKKLLIPCFDVKKVILPLVDTSAASFSAEN